MRPRGYPPMPSAQSSPMEPEGTASTSTLAVLPSVMMASSPNFVLMARIAASMAALSLPSREPTVFTGTSFFPFLNAIIYAIIHYVKSNRPARAAAEPVDRRHGDYSISRRRGEAVHKFAGLIGIRRRVVDGQKSYILSCSDHGDGRCRDGRAVGGEVDGNLRPLQKFARLKQRVQKDDTDNTYNKCPAHAASVPCSEAKLYYGV